ncbi:MAG: TolC family protein [Bacteroides sp.]
MLPLCSGCGIWNSYKPASEVPDGLYGELPQDMELTAEALTIDTTTLLTDAGWRALFTDPQLQQLIEQGLAQNSDLLTASLRVEEAEAALLSARLAYIPSLTFAPQGTASSFDHAKAVQTYSIPVAAAWEVDLFGRLRNAKRQAKALLLQQQAYRQAVQTRVISSIANTYYTLLMLDAQLDIARTTAESWRQTVSSMKALMEAGMANEAAVAQMEAAHHQVSASVLDLEEQVNSVQNALCLLLSEPAHQVARGSFAEWQFPSTLGVGVPLQLLSRRPDVRIAEQSLAAAYYAAAASRSAFYPAVTLSGSAGWTNSAGSMIVNPGKMLATAVASLTQPIFQRGALLARNKIVVAQQQESALAFRQTLLTAGTEVNEALVQYQTATAKQQHAEAQVASLQRAYDSTRLLMQHGNTTYLEVLTAQQGLLSAQLSQVAVQASRIQSVIALYEALGGEE